MTEDLVEPTPPPRSKSEKRKKGSKEILTSPTDAQQFIENLVNQSFPSVLLDDVETDDEDDCCSSSNSSTKKAPSSIDRSSKPDLVPENETMPNLAPSPLRNSPAPMSVSSSSVSPQKAVKPKIKSLLEAIRKPKELQLSDHYRDTICIRSPRRAPNLSATAPKVNNVLSGEALSSQASSQLIESILIGGGKITTWRAGGKIRCWSRMKFFNRIKAVARQIQESLQIAPGKTVALSFPHVDLDFVTAFFGCLMAGVNVISVAQPDHCTKGEMLQFKSLDVQCVFTTPLLAKNSGKKDEGKRFSLWNSIKVTVPSKTLPPAKWRVEPSRVSSGKLLMFRSSGGQITTITTTQESLSIQLGLMAQATGLSSSSRVLSLESHSNQFLISGVLLPLFVGSELFILPPELAKQSPEVWCRIADRHGISDIFCRAREFSWASATDLAFTCDLANLKAINLIDGRHPTCLNYAVSACYKIRRRIAVEPEALFGIVWSDTAGFLGRIKSANPTNSGFSSTALLVDRLMLQSGLIELHLEPSPKCILFPGYLDISPELQLICAKIEKKEDEKKVVPCFDRDTGKIWVRSDALKEKHLANLPTLSDNVFNMSITGVPGTWVDTGLIGAQLDDKVFIISSAEEHFPVAAADIDANSNISIMPIQWDLLATIITADKSAMIFRQRCHVYTVRIASSYKLVVSAELSSDSFSDEQISGLVDSVVDGLVQLHGISPYSISLHAPFSLPQNPDGTLDYSLIESKYSSGDLESIYCLSLPWRTLETSLPSSIAPGCVVGAAGMVCGAVISGTELSYASGRILQEKTGQMETLAQRLASRVKQNSDMPDEHPLIDVFGSKEFSKPFEKGTRPKGLRLTAPELHKMSTRISIILGKHEVAHGDLVLVAYNCPIRLLCAIYGCWYRGAVPVPVRAGADHLGTFKVIAEESKASFAMVPSKKLYAQVTEAIPHLHIVEIENPSKMDSMTNTSLARIPYCPPTLELQCLLDFTVTPVGSLVGRQFTWKNLLRLSQSLKDQTEVYPGRELDLAVDPMQGFGLFTLISLPVHSGCSLVWHKVAEIEKNLPEWIKNTIPHARDVFIGAAFAKKIQWVQQKSIATAKLTNVRSFNVVFQNVRPDADVLSRVSKLLETVGLSPRAVSCSTSLLPSPLISLRSGIARPLRTSCVDLTGLKNGRIKSSARGSKYCATLQEAGCILPGMEIVIADVMNQGQCGVGRLGEIWIRSDYICNTFVSSFGGDPYVPVETLQNMLCKKLEVGTAKGNWARTGMLGFLERCEDSKELSLYFIGNMNEHIQHRGFQFHPTDLEASLRRCNSSIINCCVCQVDGHMICLVETTKEVPHCPILASKITATLSDVHHVIISVVVLLRPSSIPMSTQGTPQRQRAAEMLLQDKFNPILMSYNC